MSSRQGVSKQTQARSNLRSVSRLSTGQQTLDENLMPQALKNLNRHGFTPSVVLQLQRTIGNQAVAQLVKRNTGGSTRIQRNPIKDRLIHFIQDLSQGPVINMLAQHILNVINALDSGNWATAYNLLYDRGVAKLAGHRINTKNVFINSTGKNPKEIKGEVDRAISKGMYFKGKLDLPEVMVTQGNGFDPNARTPETDQELAQQVLPVVLEEWIHMFQHQIQGFVSHGTYLFQQSPEVQQNQMLPDGQGRWNMNEVDIYAIYKDLGWDVVLSAFKARYTERQKYEFFDTPRTRAFNMQKGTIIGGHRG
jgi:hypothetical protein